MSVDRRVFLEAGLAALLQHACSAYAFTPGESSLPPKGTTHVSPPSPSSEQTDNLCGTGACSGAHISGCSVHGSFDQAYQSAFGGNGVIAAGSPELSQLLQTEYPILYSGTTLQPGVFPFDDSKSPNALATPEIVGNHGKPDGTVLMGVTFMKKLSNPFGGQLNNAGTLAVLAHEYGHIAQYKYAQKTGWKMPKGKRPELHADFIAGWYLVQKLKLTMGAHTSQGMSQASLAVKQMYEMGDTSFNSPSHHGTHTERMVAFQRGMQLALKPGYQNFWFVFESGLSLVAQS